MAVREWQQGEGLQCHTCRPLDCMVGFSWLGFECSMYMADGIIHPTTTKVQNNCRSCMPHCPRHTLKREKVEGGCRRH